MKLNWNFVGGRGVQNNKPSMGGVWIFSVTAHSIDALMVQKHNTNQIVLFQNRIHHKITSNLIDQRKIYFSENSM